jgi:uncharacterized membrane protein
MQQDLESDVCGGPMATFTVWKFDDPEGAAQGGEILLGAERDGLIEVVDVAVVSWPPGERAPRTSHPRHETAHAAGWGAFWGLLVGSVFLMPALGAAAGAGAGALTSTLSDVGITGEQVDTLRWQITEGTSALFVLTDHADIAAVGERFQGLHRLLIDTDLTDVERGRLLETFGTD